MYLTQGHFIICDDYRTLMGPSQGFWGSGENGYFFSGSWGALVIILGDLGSKPFDKRSRTISAILVKVIMRNNSVKLF